MSEHLQMRQNIFDYCRTPHLDKLIINAFESCKVKNFPTDFVDHYLIALRFIHPAFITVLMEQSFDSYILTSGFQTVVFRKRLQSEHLFFAGYLTLESAGIEIFIFFPTE